MFPPMGDRSLGERCARRIGLGSASITVSATWAMQNDARILEYLLPPVLWSAARYSSMAARDVLGVKIPAEGSPVV